MLLDMILAQIVITTMCVLVGAMGTMPIIDYRDYSRPLDLVVFLAVELAAVAMLISGTIDIWS